MCNVCAYSCLMVRWGCSPLMVGREMACVLVLFMGVILQFGVFGDVVCLP